MKSDNLAKGQEGYLNLQVENTINFNSILTDDMDRQSVHNESPTSFLNEILSLKLLYTHIYN
jgi:hypothetical protein